MFGYGSGTSGDSYPWELVTTNNHLMEVSVVGGGEAYELALYLDPAGDCTLYFQISSDGGTTWRNAASDYKYSGPAGSSSSAAQGDIADIGSGRVTLITGILAGMNSPGGSPNEIHLTGVAAGVDSTVNTYRTPFMVRNNGLGNGDWDAFRFVCSGSTTMNGRLFMKRMV